MTGEGPTLRRLALSVGEIERLVAFVEPFQGYTCAACLSCPSAFHPDNDCDCGCHRVAREAPELLTLLRGEGTQWMFSHGG